MTDPLGLIGNTAPIGRPAPLSPTNRQAAEGGLGFKELLQREIQEVNELQHQATTAIEDLAAGRRDDVESVILATQKADMAFRMLMQLRNKVMDAYEEVKQMRI